MIADTYETLDFGAGHKPVKAWIRGVPLEQEARTQLKNMSGLDFIHDHIAVLPDVHWGKGSTVGSVIPTLRAIVPAAVGVDLGCGMIAQRTTLKASDLPDNLVRLREALEEAIPHGRTNNGQPGDRGAWGEAPSLVQATWNINLAEGWKKLIEKHPKIDRGGANVGQLGTLGTGNHFVEVCLDEEQRVWIMLHSGSRGVGNRVGSYFIEKAKENIGELLGTLPDKDLAWLDEGTTVFTDYIDGLHASIACL